MGMADAKVLVLPIYLITLVATPSLQTAMAQAETHDLLVSLLEPSGPLPQAERQRINDLVVSCMEAAAENSYYGKFTTVTDESILAQCDNLFVKFTNECNSIWGHMRECAAPAFDKYIMDRGLSSRIVPEQSDSMSETPRFPNAPSMDENGERNEEEDDQSTDEEENNGSDEDEEN
jgi:hypothetical protein